MEQWKRVSLILAIFGLLKDFRPSEPFMIEFMTGPGRNITVEQVVQDVLPIGTYSFMTLLVVASLVTDYFRYKPLIIVSGLAGTAVWSLYVWSTSLEALQVLQFFYGMFLATESGFFSYIYKRVDRKHYQKINSYIRAGTLAGRFMASTLAQILIDFGITDYLGLNYISLAAQLLITAWSFLLPSVPASTHFHRREQPLDEQIELKSDNQTQSNHESTNQRSFSVLWSHVKCAFTNLTVIRYSLWSAIGVCFMSQITSYIQPLWSTIGGPDAVFWNGAVDAVLTILSCLVALLAGCVPQKYLKVQFTLPGLSITALLTAVLLFVATTASNLTVSYVGYILIGILQSFASTLVSPEIAKHIPNDSFALIFGINTVVGLAMQSMLTLAVVDSNGWFAMDIRQQFTTYSYIFIGIGLLYAVFLVVELCRRRRRKPEAEESDGVVADQET